MSEFKLNIKSILALTLILPVVVIALASVAIVYTAKSAQPQDTFVFPDDEKNVQIAAPADSKSALETVRKLTSDAENSGLLKYKGNTEVFVTDTVYENEDVDEIFSLCSSSIADKLTSFYEKTEIKYGEDSSLISSLFPKNEPSDYSFETRDGILSIGLIFSKVYDNMYFLGRDTNALYMFSMENGNVFSTVNEKFVPQNIKYVLNADEKSGEIISLSVEREYKYSSRISFLNSLAEIPGGDFEMTLLFAEKYDFSYAGIEIEQDMITLTANGYDNLSVIPYTEENLSEDEFSLSFTTSDESVLTVDENGQIEAQKESKEPVTVTVNLSYLGKEFSDSCTVYVVNEVESVTLNHADITLKIGEKDYLEAKVSPKNATVTDIIWVSSDESVATVSSTGEVKAIAAGEAEIYAVAKQGLLYTCCKVKVDN